MRTPRSTCVCFNLCVAATAKSLSHVRLCEPPWTAAYQAPPSMVFSRQECWCHCLLCNFVFCVVIFDGHFALSGHHLVQTCHHFVRICFSFPVPRDQGSQEHLSRPCLTLEDEKKMEKILLNFYLFQLFLINY